MTDPRPGANRILIWMCVLIAVNQLGFGSIGADTALAATALLLVAVALLFARFAPETHRGGRF